ncbi:MAG TPA: translation initiation factor IF-2 [Polyangiaceae bacterium]|jgi:translation initiation factor IF-2
MSKVRIYEAAKQLNVDPKAAVALFQAIGVHDVRNHMSSVEPEAIERVKRHLEKQRTHDVVEERVRTDGRVIKRRAIAKSGPESAASSARPSEKNVPMAPPSVPQPRVSEPRVVEDRASQDGRNGHAAHVAAGAAVEETPAVRRPAPSTREIPTPAPSERRAPKSSRKLISEDVSAPAAPAPVEEPHAAAPSEPATPVAPPSAPSAPAPVAAASAPHAVKQPEPEPAPVAAAPPPPPPPAPAPEPAPAPAPRIQRTGVEYWTGRPGVPMPTPASAQRTAIGGGPASSMPRRVQYDPRAGSGPARGMRPGGPMRPGMMGRGRPGQRGGMMMRGGGSGGKPSSSTQEMSAHKKRVRIEENITLSSMAAKMSLKSTELLMKLLGMGMTGVHINSTLDADTAKILASEFGWEVEDVAVSEDAALAEARAADEKTETVEAEQVVRPPVVTVMGHVDHGKTSLLDKIRKANVAGGEAGGITQHIGAYKVQTDHGTIVFLDTPGHEAFTAMRARGASATDIVVLVVAADDGVMPQTKEAIAHAKAAEVPIIVAVNKIDKVGAEPERVKRELVEVGLQPEDWGGDTMFVNVSALNGTGIPELLERISLQAEVMELKANPNLPASGIVLEALLDRGRGAVARVLVQDGTLRTGDFVLAGPGFGKVRAMTNEHGKNIAEAGPSTPVEILGLAEVPGAGDPLHVVLDPKKAQEIAESRKGKLAKSLIPAEARVSLEGIIDRLKESEMLELRIIIKGDVQGSVEAVGSALARLSTDRVRLSIIHAAVGAITEGDVNLAIASKGIIIGFNVRPAGKASALAEENKIEIRLYNIIYNAVDDVRSAMEGLLPATLVEKPNGKAEVRQLFKIKGMVIAGCYVTQGTFKRGSQCRVVRDNVVVYAGKVGSLRHLKEDVKEVPEGMECGISVDGFTELKEKDQLESFDVEEVKQKL